MLAPYGAPVVIKQKVVDSSGPRRRERAFESKWARGRYVGLSGVLDRGHLVYLPPDGDRKEKFIQHSTCSSRTRRPRHPSDGG